MEVEDEECLIDLPCPVAKEERLIDFPRPANSFTRCLHVHVTDVMKTAEFLALETAALSRRLWCPRALRLCEPGAMRPMWKNLVMGWRQQLILRLDSGDHSYLCNTLLQEVKRHCCNNNPFSVPDDEGEEVAKTQRHLVVIFLSILLQHRTSHPNPSCAHSRCIPCVDMIPFCLSTTSKAVVCAMEMLFHYLTMTMEPGVPAILASALLVRPVVRFEGLESTADDVEHYCLLECLPAALWEDAVPSARLYDEAVRRQLFPHGEIPLFVRRVVKRRPPSPPVPPTKNRKVAAPSKKTPAPPKTTGLSSSMTCVK